MFKKILSTKITKQTILSASQFLMRMAIMGKTGGTGFLPISIKT
jgi:hypothetical protein